MNPSILVTGGTGYIGSHTGVELMGAGREVFVIDNLSNSKASVLERIERIAGRRPEFAQIDVRDRAALRKLFVQHRWSSSSGDGRARGGRRSGAGGDGGGALGDFPGVQINSRVFLQ